jgi:hypothetical protein
MTAPAASRDIEGCLKLKGGMRRELKSAEPNSYCARQRSDNQRRAFTLSVCRAGGED